MSDRADILKTLVLVFNFITHMNSNNENKYRGMNVFTFIINHVEFIEILKSNEGRTEGKKLHNARRGPKQCGCIIPRISRN